MSKQHPGEVQINLTPFSREYQVVRLGRDGVTITDKWKVGEPSKTALDEAFEAKAWLDGFLKAIDMTREELAADHGLTMTKTDS